MKLLVGLGNPGKKYQKTRHNIGFMALEQFVHDKMLSETHNSWKKEPLFFSEICRIDDLLICKPQTYMNLSGKAVSAVSQYYKISPTDIWVIHDDLDLPLGNVRIKKGGRSAGHRGVTSIIETIGADFIRFRLGIGRGDGTEEIETFVVSPFLKEEHQAAEEMVIRTSRMISSALETSLEEAMNTYH